MLHANGLGIPYDRLMEIFAELGDIVVTKYIADGVVCPPELCRVLFITSTMDNIENNPSSSALTTSFHGTTPGSLGYFPRCSAHRATPARPQVGG